MAHEYSKSEKKSDGTTVVTSYRRDFLESREYKTKQEKFNSQTGVLISKEVLVGEKMTLVFK